MNNGEPIEHGFVMAWFTTPVDTSMEHEYFPNDYPVDDTLVVSATQQNKNQEN